ncbi:hypothetical protein BDV95DRAFT_600936 [Massariosphaeria phaeospora]|uniref:PARP catalytic domain-containing protein n=1 Tax=Massariosphaeria phaeospora TaxID=100035 RepID=A0A7C8IN60_9PLEO|nr:hypothetical protein BDV95DRAFT_600936 [Massariosphaeria phaeospora]
MDKLLLSSAVNRVSRVQHRTLKTFASSPKFLSKTKYSDEWHRQIDLAAGILRPTDEEFPWQLMGKYTDRYLKRKGKLSQEEVDSRLARLIKGHEAKDIAVAACAHAVSPRAVRVVLNQVAPITYHDLDIHLRSLIAANYCDSQAISNIEALWATKLLPFATHAPSAAGKFLEGLCTMLAANERPSLYTLPDFVFLERQAIRDFSSHLEGYKKECQWMVAHSAVSWMSKFVRVNPKEHPVASKPEALLDTELPSWRTWATWSPCLERITVLDGFKQRAKIPDILALEGPDFVTDNQATLRDGLVSQYDTRKPLIQYGSLVIHVQDRTREDINDSLDRIGVALDTALQRGDDAFDFFVELTLNRPVSKEALRILEAVYKLANTPISDTHESIVLVYYGQVQIRRSYVLALQDIIIAFNDAKGEDLRRVLLQPWLVRSIENYMRECQAAVRIPIETGFPWGFPALKLHGFCLVVKESGHCMPLLDEALQWQLEVLPSTEKLQDLLEIYGASQREEKLRSYTEDNALKGAVKALCLDRLVNRGTINHVNYKTVEAILGVWSTTKCPDRRALAILASGAAGNDEVALCDCLSQVTQMSEELVESFLEFIKRSRHVNGILSCVPFAKRLAAIEDAEMVRCWKGVLSQVFERQPDTIIDHSLDQLQPREWIEWMLTQDILFSSTSGSHILSRPPYFPPSLSYWVEEISEHIATIERLTESLGGTTAAVKCILNGVKPIHENDLLRIINLLAKAKDSHVEKVMQTIVGRLTRSGDNAHKVLGFVRVLLRVSPEGLQACERIIDIVEDEKVPKVVIAVSLTGWLQDEELSYDDKVALTALAFVLAIRIRHQAASEAILEATQYYKKLEVEIFEEEKRLRQLQSALKARDPAGTAILLEQLGVEGVNPLDEELEALPTHILNAVKLFSDDVAEISFQLGSLTVLQRAAFGIGTTGTTNTLFVRLYLNYTGSPAPPTFCIHFGNARFRTGFEHSPWVVRQNRRLPNGTCCGSSSPFLGHLMRALHNYLIQTNRTLIAEVYNFIKNSLGRVSHNCIICGKAHVAGDIGLRRLLPCRLFICRDIWNTLPLEHRVPELRVDLPVVDMILTSVYAAALSALPELLLHLGCPISSPDRVITILDTLPRLEILRDAADISATLRGYHEDAEDLVAWACTHYRGVIASESATSNTTIPGFPVGTRQFIIANASPKLEHAYAGKPKFYSGEPQPMILFHGTTLDRLPSILAQGLRIQSGTSLQSWGAVHGTGIYLAAKPTTSLAYSQPGPVSWKSSNMHGMRLLLGCEVVAGDTPVAPGIHVLADERKVMLRQVLQYTSRPESTISIPPSARPPKLFNFDATFAMATGRPPAWREPNAPVRMIRVIIHPEGRIFMVPEEELLKYDLIVDKARARAQRRVELHRPPITAPVFGFFALWLHGRPLIPYTDISGHMYPQNRYISPAMPNYASWTVNIAEMSADIYDDLPDELGLARRLVIAYAMGHDARAPYFQDAVMNEITKTFVPDIPLTVGLVEAVYARQTTTTRGLKKFLVDYYIWGIVLMGGQQFPRIRSVVGYNGPIPPMSEYPQQFGADVRAMALSWNAGQEVVMDFSSLWVSIRTMDNGAQRCRYHQHEANEMCFHMVIDNTPVGPQ